METSNNRTPSNAAVVRYAKDTGLSTYEARKVLTETMNENKTKATFRRTNEYCGNEVCWECEVCGAPVADSRRDAHSRRCHPVEVAPNATLHPAKRDRFVKSGRFVASQLRDQLLSIGKHQRFYCNEAVECIEAQTDEIERLRTKITALREVSSGDDVNLDKLLADVRSIISE